MPLLKSGEETDMPARLIRRKKETIYSDIIKLFFFFMPFCFGLFYEYAACICAVFMIILLLYLADRKKGSRYGSTPPLLQCWPCSRDTSSPRSGQWTAAWLCSAFSNFCLPLSSGCCSCSLGRKCAGGSSSPSPFPAWR